MPNAHALKVLYVNEAFRNFGPGPAVHGWSVVQEMQKRNVTVEIFPPVVPPTSKYAPAATERRSVFLRFLRNHLPQESTNVLSGVQRTTRRVLSALAKTPRLTPDVILARHTGYDWTPWILARVLGRPLVLEVNAPIHLEKRLVGVEPPALLRWTEQVQWRKASRIYAVSHDLETILIAAGVSRDRIVTIPNGANPLCRPPRRESTASDALRILFVGSFYPWHGVEHLLKAVAFIRHRVRNLRLLLVGAGPQTSVVRQLAVDLGIIDLVEMPGRLSHDEVNQCLCDADIAIASYPKLQPFYFSPLKIFEYMSAGLPIIASEQGQIGEILTHGETALLYPPDDITRLAESIAELVSKPALRLQLGSAALALLKKRYTWGRTAERVIDLCRDAAASDEIEQNAQPKPDRSIRIAKSEIAASRRASR